MNLGGDARRIYRKILNDISKNLSSKNNLKKLKLHNSEKDIIDFQNWLKEMYFKVSNVRGSIECGIDLKLPNLDISIEPDSRVVYLNEEKLKNFGFVVELENKAENNLDAEGFMLGEYFIEFSSEDVKIIEKACKSGNILKLCSIICPEIVVESFISILNELRLFKRFLGFYEIKADAITSFISKIEESKKLFDNSKNLLMVEEMVAKELYDLNDRIERKIADYEITLKGKNILEVMSGNISNLPLHEIENFIAEQILESEKKLKDNLRVDFSRLFSSTYPVEINEKVLRYIVEEIEREVRVNLYIECKKIAKFIVQNFDKLMSEIELAKEIEFTSTIFSLGKIFPEVSDYTAFVDGMHLFIENPQPITYSVGNSPISNGQIIILTGANSGGKTSLLELIAQIQIMGQMGLPVRAEKAWIKIFDGLYFFRKKKGVSGAGAFESSVKAFVKAVSSKGTNLILIDEFESVTEPGAAVLIMAELLKIAYERGHYVVVVSHLGKELKEHLPFARVDGIEAKGLDENFNLIVDRQPIFGRVGRSTPELIIERMYKKAKNKKEKYILSKILEKF